MKRSTGILIGSIAAAGLVLAAGVMNTKHLQRAAHDERARCELLVGREPPGQWAPPPGDYEEVAACYKSLDRRGVGVISASEKWPPVAAAVIAILGALPWAWYFLLRRIAELRAAVSGNPPSG
jgi:hypothetical protein